jgi:predicted deacetylase
VRARYLLRFDDICPTMNWSVWARVEAVLLREKITPMLAVIPDNQDGHLRIEPPDERFWDRVRQWQTLGWTIGLHGYQHLLTVPNGGLLSINDYGEFAGLPRAEQERKLQAGVAIFQRERVRSQLWIAPAHSFDKNTLEILNDFGFLFLSDGFSFFPRVDELGITWIPQQLWDFKWRPLGIWTICFHINGWTEERVHAFESNIQRYRDAICAFETIVDFYRGRRWDAFDLFVARAYRSTALLRQSLTRSFIKTA